MESYLDKLLSQICDEKQIKLEFYSDKYIAKLTKCDKVRYIVGNSFGNNSSSSAKLATDKCCTHEILKSFGVPIIEHNFVNTLNANLDFTKKYNYDVVVKPNRGSEGKSVEHLTNIKDIKKAVNKVVEYEKAAAVCPFYNVRNEYRTFYLDGQPLLTYSKMRPNVLGDGINNVENLIKIQNLKHIKIEEMSKDELEYIPKKDEQRQISWKHNLCYGSKPQIITNKNKLKQIHDLVKRAGQAIGITFASIDIVELYTGELMVLEINSAVTMTKFSEYEGHDYSKEIYGKAVDKLFE